MINKKRQIFIFVLLSFAFSINAQNFGYLGKKNIIDFQISLYTPLIQKLGDGPEFNVYRDFGENVIEAKDNIEFTYSFSYLRSLTKKMSIGLECGYQRLDTGTPTSLSRYNGSDYEHMQGKIERFQFNHFSFVPKLEFSKKGGIFGMGFKRQVGIGFATTTFLDKDYETNLPGDVNQEEIFRANMYNFNQKKFMNLILFYAMNFRKPISNNMFLNYGLRFTLNFVNTSLGTVVDDDEYWVSHAFVLDAFRSDRMYNVLSLRLGISYVFE